MSIPASRRSPSRNWTSSAAASASRACATCRSRCCSASATFESRIYDGRKQLALDLPDIRVGDIVEFAYTRSGMNPVFRGHHAGDFDMQWQVPVAHLHRRLSTATGLNLRVGQLTGAAAPQVAQADGFDERTWDVHDVPGLRVEASVPGNYNPYPWIEWSDFASWGEVARWAERLYQAPARLSPALQAAPSTTSRGSRPTPTRASPRCCGSCSSRCATSAWRSAQAPTRRAPPTSCTRGAGATAKEKALLMVTMLRALGRRREPRAGQHRAPRRHRPRPAQRRLVRPRDRARVRVTTAVDYWLDPTRSPQQGTLATVSQPDYARAPWCSTAAPPR